MKHTFSHSFATRLSIYVFSFTLIVFATIMALFYNYNHEKVTSYAIERTHGLLSNIATEISSQLMSVETTIIYMGIGKKHKPAGFIASYHRISRKE